MSSSNSSGGGGGGGSSSSLGVPLVSLGRLGPALLLASHPAAARAQFRGDFGFN
jgi:hypothetical protein